MSFSALFIRRPVATTLLTAAIVIAGAIAFRLLPVSPLPQVDYPTIRIEANVPGASPETMAATVATPLERALGRIAGITEITSDSWRGKTEITLQFDLSREINGAAREVQAAINAARTLLPTSLANNPTYKKANPSESPIVILSLTSDRYTRGEMYDKATTILAQKISRIEGVGEVNVGGGALPAIRINLNPAQLNAYGVSSESVRTAIQSTNANAPKGFVESGDTRFQIVANDQALKPSDYLPLIVSHRSGADIRLADIGTVEESVENTRNSGLLNGKQAIVLMVTRQPGANIIDTVERIKEKLPELRASIPCAMELDLSMDRSRTIRASLHEVELTLVLSVALVTGVVFLFLRDARATLIPAIAVPVSIIGTFAVMHLCGFSLNNLSLMALTVATGFVVDDAIVVLESITRRIEQGMPRLEAALKGAQEVGFTVISISISLVAVFIPILFMGDLIGRLFREFAITLSVAIAVSLLVSLTTTPMMCALLLRRHRPGTVTAKRPPLTERLFASLAEGYRRTLAVAINRSGITLAILAATVAVNIALYVYIPKGGMPQQDIGMIMGGIQSDQSASFAFVSERMEKFSDIVRADPAVDVVNASANAGGGRMFVSLKPLSQRTDTAEQVIARLRTKTSVVTGAQLFLFAPQDIRAGGRPGNASYQYTLQSDDLGLLNAWMPKIKTALSTLPEISDVNIDSQDRGLQTLVVYDRDKLSRLGLTVDQVNRTLYDAFGQRQVANLYKSLNQYHVVMEVTPESRTGPSSLDKIFVVTASGARVPFSAFAHHEYSNAPLSVDHQGQFVATTVSFNLATGTALSDAGEAIQKAMAELGVPTRIQGSFQGTAKVFQDSLKTMLLLILAAIVAMYLVLGILYESYIHPITILSTLPSAGVGALLALIAFKMDFSIIALIGVLLLIGIVKKNAIMMIDFAIDAERNQGMDTREAITKACALRFRPIMMTTMAALLGALPLAIGFGEGSELRRPLGVAIVGGLIVSQALTLYTTPVVYLYFDRLQLWLKKRKKAHAPGAEHRLPSSDATGTTA